MGFADNIPKVRYRFAWSYSRYSSYKQCPAQYRYKHILKLPEPKAPALERGGQIHDLMAMIMEGKEDQEVLKDIINGYPELKAEIAECKNLYQENGGGVEQQLAITNDWEKAEWFEKDTWCRGIVDYWSNNAFGEGHAYLVDWKTGKYNNYALKNYQEQLELFCAILFANDSTIKTITPALFFLDAGLIWPEKLKKIPRIKSNDRIIVSWQERAMYMEQDTEWNPTPNPLCKWCTFSRTKGGPCKVA